MLFTPIDQNQPAQPHSTWAFEHHIHHTLWRNMFTIAISIGRMPAHHKLHAETLGLPLHPSVPQMEQCSSESFKLSTPPLLLLLLPLRLLFLLFLSSLSRFALRANSGGQFNLLPNIWQASESAVSNWQKRAVTILPVFAVKYLRLGWLEALCV